MKNHTISGPRPLATAPRPVRVDEDFEVKRSESPIDAALSVLAKQIDELAQTVRTTERVFETVLLPEGAQNEACEPANPTPVESQLLSQIRGITRRAEAVTRHLTLLNGRAQTG